MVVFKEADFMIHKLSFNDLKTNCYIIQKGSNAIVLDPSDNAAAIIRYLEKKSLSVLLLMATHGHFDHIAAASGLIHAGVQDRLYLHEGDLFEVRKARTVMMFVQGRSMTIPKASKFDNAVKELLRSWQLEVRHFGGHSPGSVVLFNTLKTFVFTGDLLIHRALQKAKLGSRENFDEIKTFYNWLEKDFSNSTVIFPGHGEMSYYETEKQANPRWQLFRRMSAYDRG
jgi:hydroxyacylglutathione hydrolase